MSYLHNEDANASAAIDELDTIHISQVRARARWQEEMGQATLPVKYAKTSALLLGWEPDCDDTGVKDELHGLEHVLHEKYNFDVQLELMNCLTHPQEQAFQHLANFVATHNQPRTLLIIYYAGHGFSSGKGDSRIALSGRTFIDEKEKAAYSIEWDDVERTLSTTPSDVLVIFDCCYAGLLCRSAKEGLLNPTRSFQYLGACESEQLTHRAGPHSFTSAITWALGELANETSFPVTKLVKKIEEHNEFPRNQKPVLFGGRFDPIAENICISHMRGPDRKDERTDIAVDSKRTPPTKGLLELRLHYPEEVTEDQIVDTAGFLKACMQKGTLQCHEISFIDMYTRDSTSLVRRAAWKWRDYAREQSRRVASETVVTPASVASASEGKTSPFQFVCDPGTMWHRQVVVSWAELAFAFASMQALSLFVVRSLYL